MKAETPGYVFLIAVQIILFIVFTIFTDYSSNLLPKNETQIEENVVGLKYPHFQDIHVMIFIGFGFLMTFLKRYGYSATGFNLFVAALVIQWAIIMRGFFEMEGGVIKLSLNNLIGADIAAAAVLISMGAVLGRITPTQLLLMGLIEIIAFASNEHFQIGMLKIVDIGGSITVHAFGAYFGLAVSYVLRPRKQEKVLGELESSSYTSDIFAMIGTIFLWIYWPSFNSALVDGPEQERAIIHTYLALAACTVTSFICSAILNEEKKLDMVHVQNSTLAGGVAVGSCVNLIIGSGGAILIGILAGILSVCGYRYLTPKLLSKVGISDTCGVHNLHGMPAILSAVFSAIFAFMATKTRYGNSLVTVFPAMDIPVEPQNNSTSNIFIEIGRSSEQQAMFQLIGIASTLVIAVTAGLITGFILRTPSTRKLNRDELHKDDIFWEIPQHEIA